MKKRASYKVFGIITTILVISVLSIALLGNIGQGQETPSSDPLYRSFIYWNGEFYPGLVKVHPDTEIVVLNADPFQQPIHLDGLISETLEYGAYSSFRPTTNDHGVIYMTKSIKVAGDLVEPQCLGQVIIFIKAH